MARRAIETFTIFEKQHCANFKTHIVQISKSEYLEHSFANFAPSICASKDQNHTFSAKYHGRTDTHTAELAVRPAFSPENRKACRFRDSALSDSVEKSVKLSDSVNP